MPQAMQVGPLGAGGAAGVACAPASPAPRSSCCRAAAVSSCSWVLPAAAPNWSRGSSNRVESATLIRPLDGGGGGGGRRRQLWEAGWSRIALSLAPRLPSQCKLGALAVTESGRGARAMGVEHRGRVLLQRHCRWAVQSGCETLARAKSSSMPEMARAFASCQLNVQKRQG